jgi:tripartite motif-containing protein 71
MALQRHLAAGLLVMLAVVLAPSVARAQVPCPGASPTCPWVAASQIGQSAGGVLRFPQAIAIGPDGNV